MNNTGIPMPARTAMSASLLIAPPTPPPFVGVYRGARRPQGSEGQAYLYNSSTNYEAFSQKQERTEVSCADTILELRGRQGQRGVYYAIVDPWTMAPWLRTCMYCMSGAGCVESDWMSCWRGKGAGVAFVSLFLSLSCPERLELDAPSSTDIFQERDKRWLYAVLRHA